MSQSQEELYRRAIDSYDGALDRLVRAYERDPDKRLDLLQEVHLALWRSFESFEGRCSLRTWVYRVAHNTATSYVIRQRRANSQALLSLEEIEAAPDRTDHTREADSRLALERLIDLIHQLRPLDRELMLLYLEDLDSAAIGEIIGVSPGNVRTQIHRIKAILVKRFHSGGNL